jgi:hypothetical protein
MTYDFKRLGKEDDIARQYWNTDEVSLLKRAMETLFASGNTARSVDRKVVPLVHKEVLRVHGYITDNPSLPILLITDKAFQDKDKILCR